ncbi:PilX N-terminal domain-containing pilus assembly protein [Ideonella sp. A 288]|uniref:pilus assembly PilX family protein n=1 Tax=Ideonella sp. A 288 TaxID=1962181 RepID=UPI000B4AD2A1|nr:PilX N-terminal domain-containing pilus assembly protein [Ideonella sp. A 288]
MRNPPFPSLRRALPRRPRSGFTLIAILVMIVVLAFLALAAVSTGIVQERMAGNARDRNVALQAAEAALRDAEVDIEANLSLTSGFSAACGNGLCLAPSMTASNPSSAPRWTNLDWAEQSRAYGSVTGATSLKGPGNEPLASQPRYFVEMLPSLPAAVGNSVCVGCTTIATEKARAYRITVRATGVRDSTVVMLQSVYVKQ